MDIEKILGRIAFAIPIVHLVTCGLYMAGYSAGFGGNIGGLFSASDFFTITIQHLISTYLASLAIPLAILFFRHRSGAIYAADQIAAEQDENKRNDLIRQRRMVIRAVWIVMPGCALIYLAIFILQLYVGDQLQYLLTINTVVLGLTPVYWTIANKLKFYGLSVDVCWTIFAFSAAVFGQGLNNGEFDRRIPFDIMRKDKLLCQNQVVLSPIGDKFVSVTSDNIRHVIDHECKVLFDFEKKATIPRQSLYELVSAKFFPPHEPISSASHGDRNTGKQRQKALIERD